MNTSSTNRGLAVHAVDEEEEDGEALHAVELREVIFIAGVNLVESHVQVMFVEEAARSYPGVLAQISGTYTCPEPSLQASSRASCC